MAHSYPSAHIVTFPAPRQVAVESYEEPPPGPGQVRLRTLYSGISAGTELSAYRGTNPYLHSRWDDARRLFVPDEEPGLQYPVRGWGYEEVGRVEAIGPDVTAVAVGDLVYGTWGHRTHHTVQENDAREHLLPEGLPPIAGIFSHIASIALNGVHDARIRIGDTVAVFGLGVPGQLAAQLARASGATVVGVDLYPARLQKAQELEAVDVALNAAEGQVAEQIRELTGGRGADVSLEVTGAAAALNEAIRATTYSARVVTLGFFQGEARNLYLGQEFHHNRINLVCSQISGVAPELSYRWNRLRLNQTAMELAARGVLRLQPLITQTFAIDQAAEAFRLLDEQPQEALQVVLDMTDKAEGEANR